MITMQRLLTRAKNDGYRLVYADETMITRTSVKPTEWARKKENMTFDGAKLNEPTLALLAAISKDKGLEHWQLFPKSVNVTKFKEWLAGLKAANSDEKLCLFMDNLGVHRAEDTTTEMKRLGFRWIFNLPYSPE